MKKLIEKRYEYTPDGVIIIDITVGNIYEIYDNFDKKASFSRKELDQDFIDYIVESAGEIKKHRFQIRISPEKPVQNSDKERIEQSIKNYLLYLKEVELLNVKKNINKILLLLMLGILLISVSVSGWFNDLMSIYPSMKIMHEGITIAAWVSLWQVFALVLFEWYPYFQKIRLYKKLYQSDIVIESHPS